MGVDCFLLTKGKAWGAPWSSWDDGWAAGWGGSSSSSSWDGGWAGWGGSSSSSSWGTAGWGAWPSSERMPRGGRNVEWYKAYWRAKHTGPEALQAFLQQSPEPPNPKKKRD